MRKSAIAGLIVWLMTSGSAAHAFECAKATTETEKAICGSQSAKAANDAMESAYFELRDRQTEAGRKLLTDGQRAWLKYRDNSCAAEAGCLEMESNARRDWLSRTPDGMTPLFLYKPSAPRDYEVIVDAYLFTDERFPAARQWNAAVQRMVDESPYSDPPEKEDHHVQHSHEISVSIEYSDASLLSGLAGFYDYSGGAHPNGWTEAINLDAKTGEFIDALKLFGETGVRTLAESCARQIAAAKQDLYGDLGEEAALGKLEEDHPGVVLEHVGDMERWSFGEKGGTVWFDSYAIGAYAEGPYECAFDWPTVKETAIDKRLFELVR